MDEVKNVSSTVLPIQPNWSSSVQEKHTYKTTIQTSEEGRESRTGSRRVPRVSYNFVADTVSKRAEQQRLMFRDGARTEFPDPIRWVWVDGAASGATEIAAESIPQWLYAGAQVIVHSGEAMELVTVQEVAGLTVTISALSFTHLTKPRLSLSRKVTRAREENFNSVVQRHLRHSTSLDIEPRQPDDLTVNLGFPEYRYVPVFPFKPNWASGEDSVLDTGAERIDLGVGLVGVQYGVRKNRVKVEFDVVRMTQADAKELFDLYYICRGRLGSFWYPYFRLEAAPSGGAGLSSMSLDGDFLLPYFEDLEMFPVVYVYWPDGAFQIVGVSEAVANSGAVDLTLIDNLSRDVDSSCTVAVGALSRFNSDEVEVEWLTSSVGRSKLGVTTVESGHVFGEGIFGPQDVSISRSDSTVLFSNYSPYEWRIDLDEEGVSGPAIDNGEVFATLDIQNIGLYVPSTSYYDFFGTHWRGALIYSQIGFFKYDGTKISINGSYINLSDTGADTNVYLTGAVPPETASVRFRIFVAFTPFYTDQIICDLKEAKIEYPVKGFYNGVSGDLKWP